MTGASYLHFSTNLDFTTLAARQDTSLITPAGRLCRLVAQSGGQHIGYRNTHTEQSGTFLWNRHTMAFPSAMKEENAMNPAYCHVLRSKSTSQSMYL